MTDQLLCLYEGSLRLMWQIDDAIKRRDAKKYSKYLDRCREALEVIVLSDGMDKILCFVLKLSRVGSPFPYWK